MASTNYNFDKFTLPKIPPEKAVADYLISKKQNEMVKQYPVWDLPRISPEIVLVSAKRKLYDVEQRLNHKRIEAQKLRKEIDAQWKDLAEKEELLRQSFIKFNKFVKENQEKRDRAEKKAAEEIALQEKRDADIVDIKEKLAFMLDVKSKLEKNLRDFKMYEQYLQAVVKVSSDYKGINDILNRYEELAEARCELAERQEADTIALENARSNMMKLTEEKTLAIMGLNNTVADLQIRYENAKSMALQWEIVVTKIKNMCVSKTSELNSVRASCWNIYRQMCRRKEIEPQLEEWDVENQMLFIKKTMLELRHIVKVAKKRGTREMSAK